MTDDRSTSRGAKRGSNPTGSDRNPKTPGRREAIGMISMGALTIADSLFNPRAADAQPVLQGRPGTTLVKPVTLPFLFEARTLTVTPSNPQAGATVTIRLTVQTSGSGTKSVPWRIRRGSATLKQGTKTNVSAGSSFIETATWQATAGSHTFRGEVDPSNSLNESSSQRANNTKTVNVTVPEPPNWPAWGAAAWTGTKQSINLWQTQAKLVGVKIMAVSAIGGKIVGPSIKNLIKTQMQSAGAPSATADKFATAVADAWKLWHEGVKVPGLPWYPAFAAFPGPQAPPMPNVPTPLATLPSTQAGQLAPNALKNRIRNKLGTSIMNQPGASAAVDAFVNSFTLRFATWNASLQVRNVMGKGPVPSFAPPYVPVGPVVNGNTIEAPGAFTSPAF